jgi:hypothetical protein
VVAFPEDERSMSIPTILAKVLLKLVGFDIAHYLVQYNPQPALRQCPRRRHDLRSCPEPGPALRLGGLLHCLRGIGGVHDR